ncbi:MAG: hypothetical protein ACRESR_09645 [Gammaproteobacteria bacterium]
MFEARGNIGRENVADEQAALGAILGGERGGIQCPVEHDCVGNGGGDKQES